MLKIPVCHNMNLVGTLPSVFHCTQKAIAEIVFQIQMLVVLENSFPVSKNLEWDS